MVIAVLRSNVSPPLKRISTLSATLLLRLVEGLERLGFAEPSLESLPELLT